MLHVKHSDAHKKRRITMDAAARFAGSRFMRLREIGAIRKGYIPQIHITVKQVIVQVSTQSKHIILSFY